MESLVRGGFLDSLGEGTARSRMGDATVTLPEKRTGGAGGQAQIALPPPGS